MRSKRRHVRTRAELNTPLPAPEPAQSDNVTKSLNSSFDPAQARLDAEGIALLGTVSSDREPIAINLSSLSSTFGDSMVSLVTEQSYIAVNSDVRVTSSAQRTEEAMARVTEGFERLGAAMRTITDDGSMARALAQLSQIGEARHTFVVQLAKAKQEAKERTIYYRCMRFAMMVVNGIWRGDLFGK